MDPPNRDILCLALVTLQELIASSDRETDVAVLEEATSSRPTFFRVWIWCMFDAPMGIGAS